MVCLILRSSESVSCTISGVGIGVGALAIGGYSFSHSGLSRGSVGPGVGASVGGNVGDEVVCVGEDPASLSSSASSLLDALIGVGDGVGPS